MKQVFELRVDGKFIQYLLKSELPLLSRLWSPGTVLSLTCVEIDEAKYNILFHS